MIPLGALLAKLVDKHRQASTVRCPRCRLYYPRNAARCSHCGVLQGAELTRFLEKLEEDRADIANLGEFFYICGTIVLVIMMLIMAMDGTA